MDAAIVRVMTWNLWWRFGPWEQRQSAIAAVLRAERPDVVCLQEVWAEEGGSDQAAVLADALGHHHVRSPSPFRRGVSFGNAVLSRWPVTATAVESLPGDGAAPTPRTALLATIDAPFGTLRVVSTHLEYAFDGSATRQAQVRAVAAFVAAHRGPADRDFPVVVAGDLNSVPDSDEMRSLTGRTRPLADNLVFQDAWEVAGDGSPGHTWSGANPYQADSTWPNRRLDYVLVSWPRPSRLGTPVRCRLAGVDAVDGVVPSDHYAVVADLRCG